MGYKKGPVGHMKASTGNKAVGYMAEGSMAYMSALHQIDPRSGKKLDEVVVKANKKLENSADVKSGYGNTQEKTVITAPKQRKLDIGAYEQSYREAGKAATGKDFGYRSNRASDVEATSEEKAAAGFGEAYRRGITDQRKKFQKTFGEGAQPSKPFLNPDIQLASAYDAAAKDRLSKSFRKSGDAYKKTVQSAKDEANQRFESNVLAEKARRKIEQKPVTITTTGVADASTYQKPEEPKKETKPKSTTKKKVKGRVKYKKWKASTSTGRRANRQARRGSRG